MSDAEDFQAGDAGAKSTFPMQCSALRKGGYVMIKSRPCKLVDMSTSKTGKHGHAKVHMVALDIFTGKKLEDMSPSTHNMDVPVVKRKDYIVIDINSSDGFMTLMDQDTAETREDLKLPDNELGKEIETAFEKKDDRDVVVTAQSACNEEAIVSFKMAADKS